MNDFLDRTQFINRTINEIRDYLPDQFQKADYVVEKYQKQYGEVEGLGIRLPGDDSMPVINLKDLYQEYLFEMEQQPQMKSDTAFRNVMHTLADVICESYDRMKEIDFPELIPDNYEKMKEQLVIALVSMEGREEFLKDKPYEVVGSDLAIIYKLEIGDGDVYRRATVTNKMMEGFEVTPGQLIEEALEISSRNNPARVSSLYEDLAGSFPDLETPLEGEGPIVVTTENTIEGAAALFYPGVMEKAAERIQGSYFAIPSSVHEFILLPEEEGFKSKELEQLVKQVNQTAVSPKDRLSDRVYHYDANEKLFERADTFENRKMKKEIMESLKKDRPDNKEVRKTKQLEM